MNVHDLGYSILFSNKVIFRQLLETFVKQPWVAEIDFEQLEKLNKSFISKKHLKHESDLIYKVKLKDKTAYIVVLIEFQSTVQKFMAVRVLHYIMSFYLDLMKQKSLEKLPPVFPIVLYNGDRKWTAPVELHELIENHELLGEFGIQFKYFKIAENEFSAESLLKIQNLVSTIFLSEIHYDLDQLLDEIRELFKKEDRPAISLLFNWFRYLYQNKRITEADFEQLSQVYYDEGEVSMLIQSIRKEHRIREAQQRALVAQQRTLEETQRALDEERRQFAQQIQQERFEGKSEGILEGELKGELKGKLEIARSMLQEGLSVELIVKITQLSQEDIEKLRA